MATVADNVGFAATVALTRTARDTAQVFMPQYAAKVFDRPTPYTLNAFYYQPATLDKTAFEIGIKNFGGKGTPASAYLMAEIVGGQRAMKRSERLLSTLIGTDGYWVPGPGLKLDAYGNVSGPLITAMLSDLQAQYDVWQNRTSNSVKRNKQYANRRFFLVDANSSPIGRDGSLRTAIYMRQGNKVIPMLIFIKSPSYKPIFDFFNQGIAYAEKIFPDQLALALKQGYGNAN